MCVILFLSHDVRGSYPMMYLERVHLSTNPTLGRTTQERLIRKDLPERMPPPLLSSQCQTFPSSGPSPLPTWVYYSDQNGGSRYLFEWKVFLFRYYAFLFSVLRGCYVPTDKHNCNYRQFDIVDRHIKILTVRYQGFKISLKISINIKQKLRSKINTQINGNEQLK